MTIREAGGGASSVTESKDSSGLRGRDMGKRERGRAGEREARADASASVAAAAAAAAAAGSRALPLKSLNHVSIHCGSVEESLRFYCDLMGFIPIKRPDCLNFDGAWLHNYGIGIHLLKETTPEAAKARKREINPKADHVSFQCEDILVVEALLQEQGIPFVRQTVEECGILVKQLFFHDPDGHMIEICNCDVLPVVPVPPNLARPACFRTPSPVDRTRDWLRSDSASAAVSSDAAAHVASAFSALDSAAAAVASPQAGGGGSSGAGAAASGLLAASGLVPLRHSIDIVRQPACGGRLELLVDGGVYLAGSTYPTSTTSITTSCTMDSDSGVGNTTPVCRPSLCSHRTAPSSFAQHIDFALAGGLHAGSWPGRSGSTTKAWPRGDNSACVDGSTVSLVGISSGSSGGRSGASDDVSSSGSRRSEGNSSGGIGGSSALKGAEGAVPLHVTPLNIPQTSSPSQLCGPKTVWAPAAGQEAWASLHAGEVCLGNMGRASQLGGMVAADPGAGPAMEAMTSF